MDTLTVFFSTFVLVFIGELGDKTQIAAGTGTLANKKRISVIFFSSALALVTVAGLTVFFAGLIPKQYLPTIVTVGGTLLILYGLYLYRKAGVLEDYGPDEELVIKSSLGLFASHYTVVFIAELGDKTQVATLAVAVDNPLQLPVVFLGSSVALTTVTAVTVWGVTKIPSSWTSSVQKIGAGLMVAYGLYMFLSPV